MEENTESGPGEDLSGKLSDVEIDELIGEVKNERRTTSPNLRDQSFRKLSEYQQKRRAAGLPPIPAEGGSNLEE